MVQEQNNAILFLQLIWKKVSGNIVRGNFFVYLANNP